MYRRHSEPSYRWLPGAVLVTLVLGGCANPALNESGGQRAANNGSGTTQADASPALPARPARVEVEDEVGFTVTEVVSITGDVRADYREALRLMAQDDFAGGIALLLQVTEKAPEATAPFVDLGIAYGRSGDLDKAEAAINRALASTPDHPVAHNELGIIHRKQGRFYLARQSYERALAIYPGFHYARRNLAVLCDLYLADMTCALEHYEIYRASVADDREVDIWISDIRNRLGQAE